MGGPRFLRYDNLHAEFACIRQRSYNPVSTSNRSSPISSVEALYIRRYTPNIDNAEWDFADTATARVRQYLQQRSQIAVQRNAHVLRGCMHVSCACQQVSPIFANIGQQAFEKAFSSCGIEVLSQPSNTCFLANQDFTFCVRSFCKLGLS